MPSEHEFRIVITPFCNYRCFYCHREGLTEESTPLALTPKDYQFMCKVAKERWGWDTVTITGGEPLKDNTQINISVHSLTPEIYRQITKTTYPVAEVLDTIISIRAQMPKLEIHLNATVIRGMNDSIEEMTKLIKFAHRVNAKVKFIDLASGNEKLIVPVEEITQKLLETGFEKVEETKWQIFVRNSNGEEAIITRCGFGKKYADWGYRNLFINPDGMLSTEVADDIPLNLLHEIRARDEDAFACKVEWLFPPLRLKDRPQ